MLSVVYISFCNALKIYICWHFLWIHFSLLFCNNDPRKKGINLLVNIEKYLNYKSVMIHKFKFNPSYILAFPHNPAFLSLSYHNFVL